MKKVLTFTALFIFACATVTQAQFVLGGNIGFSTNTIKDEPSGDEHKTTSLNLIPRLGYIFGDNWAGLEVGINSIMHTDDSDRETKTTLTTVAPFFRHNFLNVNNMGIWMEAQAGAIFGKSEFDGTETAKFTGFGAGIRPGVIFYVGDHLSFDVSFGRLAFSQMKSEDPNDSDNNTTDTDFGLNLNGENFLFGVNWSFGGGSDD
ncbi:MAG: outer membrane beta-barrel protein [Saprospiraceae bacterium]|nr:outer membrane beta-barrel protein [Saprospiraceae bacterium]